MWREAGNDGNGNYFPFSSRNCSTHEVTAFEQCAFRGLIKSFAERSPNKYLARFSQSPSHENENGKIENKFDHRLRTFEASVSLFLLFALRHGLTFQADRFSTLSPTNLHSICIRPPRVFPTSRNFASSRDLPRSRVITAKGGRKQKKKKKERERKKDKAGTLSGNLNLLP